MKYAAWIICVCCLPNIAFASPTTAERKSQFEKAMSLIMTSAPPTVSPFDRERVLEEYMNGRRNKGQAVQLLIGRYYRSEYHEDVAVTGERTLEACQLRYAKPCALLAINEEIAAEGELISKDMPRLHYHGEFDLSQIPIMRLVRRNRVDVQNYYAAAAPKAIAIHPWGRVFVSTGNANLNDAQAAALAKCNGDPDRKNRDGPCFVYAINNNVVLPERLTTPK